MASGESFTAAITLGRRQALNRIFPRGYLHRVCGDNNCSVFSRRSLVGFAERLALLALLKKRNTGRRPMKINFRFLPDARLALFGDSSLQKDTLITPARIKG